LGRGVLINKRLTTTTDKPSKVSFEEALNYIKTVEKRCKFDETVEISINLESKVKDLSVRGSVEAPKGLGRAVKIAVFSDNAPEGVTYSGGEDLVQQFLNGSIKDCDVCISTRKYIPLVSSKIGKLLGRRRIMPDARFGTVTDEVDAVIASFKKGRMNFRSNKNVIHAILGKISFSNQDLRENFEVLLKEIMSALPEKASIKKMFIGATMGKSIEIKFGGG